MDQLPSQADGHSAVAAVEAGTGFVPAADAALAAAAVAGVRAADAARAAAGDAREQLGDGDWLRIFEERRHKPVSPLRR